ncbi:MAG TPA: YceI family protein [Flavobacterium sp.]|uniref:YceI family protein n=1 Tax=Flavobacterium sp. TaxID=239 RepID=UPI002DBA8353|nr:YceI family protein [Flavobacterium sp.]HEU4789189.1 YceI family protein [Flavobacterium sp.]
MENIKWEIDPTHSEVYFKIKHLEIATLTGRFDKITGTAEAEEDFENTEFYFTANVDSINTNDQKRDAHLKSADFFDAEKFPKITFHSTKFKRIGDATFELIGKLTIKEITKPTILEIKYGGTNIDPWGNTKAGLKLKGKINRRDFGLVWNAAIETGGFLVSEEVKINANIELLKK